MANIVEIRDIGAPELGAYAKLTEAQLRCRLEEEKGIFIAESPKVINTALDCGLQPLSLLTERRHITGSAAAVIERCGDIPVYTADGETLRQLSGYELTRGVLCAMRRPLPRQAEEICASARRIAVLEGITDATNLGAIFRSAAALGVEALLLTPDCCDALNRRAVRVSMGSVFLVPWARLGGGNEEWPQAGLERLRRMGFTTAAMALREDALSIDDARLAAAERLALIFGTEGDGLKHDTIAGCDYTVRIPMQHGVDSLNVAAASAVAFWQLRAK